MAFSLLYDQFISQKQRRLPFPHLVPFILQYLRDAYALRTYELIQAFLRLIVGKEVRMSRKRRILEQITGTLCEGSLFVGSHEAAVTNDIGRQNGSQAALPLRSRFSREISEPPSENLYAKCILGMPGNG